MRKLLWLSIMIAIGAYIAGSLADPDLWWHIGIGRWILSRAAVPYFDYWNAFSAGPWIAYSWPFEALVAAVDGAFGVPGLYLAQLLLAIFISISLAAILSRLAGDWFFGSLWGVYATLSFHSHFTLRPQAFIWVLLALLYLVLERISEEGLKRKYALQLVLIFAAWANLHITTALGLMVIPLWLYGRQSKGAIARCLGLAFLGTLITPYFGAEWLTFLSKTGHPLQHAAISEFKPATILLFSTAFLLLALSLVAAFFHYRPRTVEPGKLILLFIFSVLGLGVIKFLPFAVVTACALLCLYWRRERWNSVAFGNLGEGIERLKNLYLSIPKEGLTFVFLCWATVSILNGWRAPLNYYSVPVKAFDFFETHALPLPLLNSFGSGGYAIYRFTNKEGDLPSPAHRVSIDGRTNVVPQPVWEKFMNAFEGKENWEEYLALVNPQTIIWRNESPLTSILPLTGKWCRVFRESDGDEGYSIYLKKELLPNFPKINPKSC